MDKHYLRNLSVEVVLANAGYNGRHWKEYVLPRSRGSHLLDEHVKRLIEKFYPDLYLKCDRATAAMEGNPWYQEDAISETNWRFLHNLREITFFWLQDACVLVNNTHSIASVQPWRVIFEDEQCRNDIQRLGTTVLGQIALGQQQQHAQMLAQQELLQAVSAGASTAANLVNNRVSSLSVDVGYSVSQVNARLMEQVCCNPLAIHATHATPDVPTMLTTCNPC